MCSRQPAHSIVRVCSKRYPSPFNSISESAQVGIRVCSCQYPSRFPGLYESAQVNDPAFSPQYPSLLKSLSESIQAVRSWPPLGLPAGQPNGPARRRGRLGRAALRLERRPRAGRVKAPPADRTAPDAPGDSRLFHVISRPICAGRGNAAATGGLVCVCVHACARMCACARARACACACVCVFGPGANPRWALSQGPLAGFEPSK